MRFDVFFDYQCPFVYRAALLLDAVRRSGVRDLDVRWRYFSLTQVNSKDEGWTIWDAPDSELAHGRLAFQAAEAARRQGRFDDMHHAMLNARHRDRLELDDMPVVEKLASDVGLDMDEFRRDVADRGTLRVLARDHQAAVAEHGVFGTPTFVFADGAAAYVRLTQAASENGVEVFDRLVAVAAAEPQILEIKRPRKPA
jgi:predicted DsbA family dithiol-disulfide isomerase